MNKNTQKLRKKDMVRALDNEQKLIRANIELKVIYEQNLKEIDRVNKEYELVVEFIKLNYKHDFWETFNRWKESRQ